jgi:hypothetical protein
MNITFTVPNEKTQAILDAFKATKSGIDNSNLSDLDFFKSCIKKYVINVEMNYRLNLAKNNIINTITTDETLIS